jgi:Tol biopolymer transport system component
MRVFRFGLYHGLCVAAALALAACDENATSSGGDGSSGGGGISLTDTLVRLTDDTQYDRNHPCWNSSGSEIFYTRYEIVNPGNILISEIYSMSALNGREKQFSNFRAITDFPSVKPSYVAYRSNHNGHFNIYYGGTNWETPVTNTEGKDFEIAVTPSGATGRLAFSKADSLHGGIVYNIYMLGSTGLVKVSNGNKDFHPTWSPGLGMEIAFQRTHGEPYGAQIMVISRHGGSEVEVTPYGESCYHPDWNHGYDTIAFCRGGDVFMRDPDGSNEVQLTFDTQFAQYPAWSPNGKYLAYVDFISNEGRYIIFIKDVEHILTAP